MSRAMTRQTDAIHLQEAGLPERIQVLRKEKCIGQFALLGIIFVVIGHN